MIVEIHVEVEHDLEDEPEDLDASDQKEEDVVRCLCGVYEDSGLMIQVWCGLVRSGDVMWCGVM